MNDSPQLSATSLELAVDLTTAWLANSSTRASEAEVLGFLQMMHKAVDQLSRAEPMAVADEATSEHTPAVSVRKSLASKDHIISMIDGRPYRTLRRHITHHGLTPDQYRERYGLKADYPMVAESYSEARRAMAKKIGLGRKPELRRKGGAQPSGAAPKGTGKRASGGA